MGPYFAALLLFLTCALGVLSVKLWLSLRQAQQRLGGILDLDKEVKKTTQELERLRFEQARLAQSVRELDEEANLQEFAFYKPQYNFPDSSRYEAELSQVRISQSSMLRADQAVVRRIQWQVNGSYAEGKKQTDQLIRLMLRAFNGECDAAMLKVRYHNVHVMEKRIKKAYDAINASAAVQQCYIEPLYLQLKMQELHLFHEYQSKLQEEKEIERELREQMREEEKAQREFEKQKEEAEKEERRYQESLKRAREELLTAHGAKQENLQRKILELEQKLLEAQGQIRAVSQAQLTKSGYVYVISNVGSFGGYPDYCVNGSNVLSGKRSVKRIPKVARTMGQL